MLVGICGKMGSGKDTIADYLVGKFLGKKIAFAERLKELAKELFNVEKKDKRGRRILQQLGAAMRSIDEDVWINSLMYNYNPEEFTVISDIRYLNEARAIINKGGIVIHIEVPDYIRKERIEKRDGIELDNIAWNYINRHGSEIGVDLVEKLDNIKHIFVTPNDDIDIVNKKALLCIPRKKLDKFFL